MLYSYGTHVFNCFLVNTKTYSVLIEYLHTAHILYCSSYTIQDCLKFYMRDHFKEALKAHILINKLFIQESLKIKISIKWIYSTGK